MCVLSCNWACVGSVVHVDMNVGYCVEKIGLLTAARKQFTCVAV